MAESSAPTHQSVRQHWCRGAWCRASAEHKKVSYSLICFPSAVPSRGWPSRQHHHHIRAAAHRCRGAWCSHQRELQKVGYSLICFSLQYITRMAESSTPITHIRGARHRCRGACAEPSAPTPESLYSPDYVFLLQYITRMPSRRHEPPYPWHRAINAEPSYIHSATITIATHHFAEDHHYLSLSRQREAYKSPPPFHRAVTADANTWAESLPLIPLPLGEHQRRGNINNHHHLATVSADANTMGRVITIDHHSIWAERINHHHHLPRSAPMPTPWAEPLPFDHHHHWPPSAPRQGRVITIVSTSMLAACEATAPMASPSYVHDHTHFSGADGRPKW